jgi:hypothetical protein
MILGRAGYNKTTKFKGGILKFLGRKFRGLGDEFGNWSKENGGDFYNLKKTKDAKDNDGIVEVDSAVVEDYHKQISMATEDEIKELNEDRQLQVKQLMFAVYWNGFINGMQDDSSISPDDRKKFKFKFQINGVDVEDDINNADVWNENVHITVVPDMGVYKKLQYRARRQLYNDYRNSFVLTRNIERMKLNSIGDFNEGTLTPIGGEIAKIFLYLKGQGGAGVEFIRGGRSLLQTRIRDLAENISFAGELKYLYERLKEGKYVNVDTGKIEKRALTDDDNEALGRLKDLLDEIQAGTYNDKMPMYRKDGSEIPDCWVRNQIEWWLSRRNQPAGKTVYENVSAYKQALRMNYEFEYGRKKDDVIAAEKQRLIDENGGKDKTLQDRNQIWESIKNEKGWNNANINENEALWESSINHFISEHYHYGASFQGGYAAAVQTLDAKRDRSIGTLASEKSNIQYALGMWELVKMFPQDLSVPNLAQFTMTENDYNMLIELKKQNKTSSYQDELISYYNESKKDKGNVKLGMAKVLKLEKLTFAKYNKLEGEVNALKSLMKGNLNDAMDDRIMLYKAARLEIRDKGDEYYRNQVDENIITFDNVDLNYDQYIELVTFVHNHDQLIKDLANLNKDLTQAVKNGGNVNEVQEKINEKQKQILENNKSQEEILKQLKEMLVDAKDDVMKAANATDAAMAAVIVARLERRIAVMELIIKMIGDEKLREEIKGKFESIDNKIYQKGLDLFEKSGEVIEVVGYDSQRNTVRPSIGPFGLQEQGKVGNQWFGLGALAHKYLSKITLKTYDTNQGTNPGNPHKEISGTAAIIYDHTVASSAYSEDILSMLNNGVGFFSAVADRAFNLFVQPFMAWLGVIFEYGHPTSHRMNIIFMYGGTSANVVSEDYGLAIRILLVVMFGVPGAAYRIIRIFGPETYKMRERTVDGFLSMYQKFANGAPEIIGSYTQRLLDKGSMSHDAARRMSIIQAGTGFFFTSILSVAFITSTIVIVMFTGFSIYPVLGVMGIAIAGILGVLLSFVNVMDAIITDAMMEPDRKWYYPVTFIAGSIKLFILQIFASFANGVKQGLEGLSKYIATGRFDGTSGQPLYGKGSIFNALVDTVFKKGAVYFVLIIGSIFIFQSIAVIFSVLFIFVVFSLFQPIKYLRGFDKDVFGSESWKRNIKDSFQAWTKDVKHVFKGERDQVQEKRNFIEVVAIGGIMWFFSMMFILNTFMLTLFAAPFSKKARTSIKELFSSKSSLKTGGRAAAYSILMTLAGIGVFVYGVFGLYVSLSLVGLYVLFSTIPSLGTYLKDKSPLLPYFFIGAGFVSAVIWYVGLGGWQIFAAIYIVSVIMSVFIKGKANTAPAFILPFPFLFGGKKTAGTEDVKQEDAVVPETPAPAQQKDAVVPEEAAFVQQAAKKTTRQAAVQARMAEAANDRQEIFSFVFGENYEGKGFTINAKELFSDGRIRVSKDDIKKFVNNLKNEGIDIASLEGKDIPSKMIRKMQDAEELNKFLGKLVTYKADLTIDNIIDPPVKIRVAQEGVRNAFARKMAIKGVEKWIKDNYAPYRAFKSELNNFNIIVSGNDQGAKNEAAMAKAMNGLGIWTFIAYRGVKNADKKYSKLKPNTVISKKVMINGELTEVDFKIKHYVYFASNKITAKETASGEIVAEVVPLSHQGFFTEAANGHILDEVYVESMEQFAQDMDGSVQMAGAQSGAIIYGEDVTAPEVNAQQEASAAAKFDWSAFSNYRFDTVNDETAISDKLIEFYNSVETKKDKGRIISGYETANDLKAVDNATNLTNPESASRFIAREISKGVSIIRLDVGGNVAEIIEAVLKKDAKNVQAKKALNFIEQGKDVSKVLNVKLSELNENLIEQIYRAGFNGINVIISADATSGQLNRLNSLSDKMGEYSKLYGLEIRNYVTVEIAALMKMDPSEIGIIKNLADKKIMPNIDFGTTRIDPSSKAKLNEVFNNINYSIRLDSMETGEETEGIDPVVLGTPDTDSLKKDKNNHVKTEASFSKAYASRYAANRSARTRGEGKARQVKDSSGKRSAPVSYIAKFDEGKVTPERLNKLDKYMYAETEKESYGETDFDEMLELLEELGITDASRMYMRIKQLKESTDGDAKFRYAMAKADLRFAVLSAMEQQYLEFKGIKFSKDNRGATKENQLKDVKEEDLNAVRELMWNIYRQQNQKAKIDARSGQVLSVSEISKGLTSYRFTGDKENMNNMNAKDLRQTNNPAIYNFLESLEEPDAGKKKTLNEEELLELLAVMNVSIDIVFIKAVQDVINATKSGTTLVSAILRAA